MFRKGRILKLAEGPKEQEEQKNQAFRNSPSHRSVLPPVLQSSCLNHDYNTSNITARAHLAEVKPKTPDPLGASDVCQFSSTNACPHT